jgi:hypothetical protein
MSGAFLAALAGVAGLMIGRLWDSRAEIARWRRDQRVRVYEDLASAYYAVREAIRALAMTDPETAEAESAEIRVLEAAVEWNRDVVAAWLHGSKLVTVAVEDFDHEVTGLYHRARLRRFTWIEFQEDRESAQEALERYIEAVRRELRRPAINVRIHYPALGIPLPSQPNAPVAPPDRESASENS